MNDSRAFWRTQSSSNNQSSELAFYQHKAAEHAALMSADERVAGCLDLGCGAGEMLKFLAEDVNVKVGLDFSESMLAAARIALAGSDIELTSEDAFTYLVSTPIPIWTTTGAMNQYLSAQDLRRLLGLFDDNRSAKAFFLYDCIDPLRYRLMPLGISYRPDYAARMQSVTMRVRLLHLLGVLRYSAQLILGKLSKDVVWLGNPAMGYAVAPHFWHQVGRSLGLDVQIVSSRYYEYRYHVILRKNDG